jgi:hypothetical protein
VSRGRISAVILGSIAAAALGLASLSFAKEAPLKQIMGENFAGLQNVLVGLITANYAAIPDQVTIIHDHAVELTQSVPENAEHDRARFLAYAYNLQGHATDLKSIVQELMVHDAAIEGEGRMVPDQLREAAAAHYGGMVTMCVSCHNRFRLQAVSP